MGGITAPDTPIGPPDTPIGGPSDVLTPTPMTPEIRRMGTESNSGTPTFNKAGTAMSTAISTPLSNMGESFSKFEPMGTDIESPQLQGQSSGKFDFGTGGSYSMASNQKHDNL